MIHDRNIQVSRNKNFNQVMMQIVIDFQNNYSSNYYHNISLNQFKETYGRLIHLGICNIYEYHIDIKIMSNN